MRAPPTDGMDPADHEPVYLEDVTRCEGCDEYVSACACSEAETVRRQFRDELVALLGRGELLADAGAFPSAAGTYAGAIKGLLIRFCGMSYAEVLAAGRGGR